MAKEIPIYEGDSPVGDILLDEEDYERLSKYDWYLDRHTNKPYRRIDKDDGRHSVLALARDVFGLKIGDNRIVHYKDTSNYLDNRRSNLRLGKERVNRRTLRSSRGHVWPPTLKRFKVFITERPESEFFENSITKDDVVELVSYTQTNVWKLAQIELHYELGSDLYKTAKDNQANFKKLLNYYFDWTGVLNIIGKRSRLEPETVVDDITPDEIIVEEPQAETVREEPPSVNEVKEVKATVPFEDEDHEEYLPVAKQHPTPPQESIDLYRSNKPRYASKDLSGIPSKILMREILDRGDVDVGEIAKEILPHASLEVLMREINGRSNLKCEITFS